MLASSAECLTCFYSELLMGVLNDEAQGCTFKSASIIQYDNKIMLFVHGYRTVVLSLF